jgi:hypothetical protein
MNVTKRIPKRISSSGHQRSNNFSDSCDELILDSPVLVAMLIEMARFKKLGWCEG